MPLFTPAPLISVISPSFKNPNMASERATLLFESEQYEQMPCHLLSSLSLYLLSSPSEMETADLGKRAMWFCYLNCRFIRAERKWTSGARAPHLFAESIFPASRGMQGVKTTQIGLKAETCLKK